MFGLAEKDWVMSLSAVNFDDVIYEPFIESARKFANELKNNDVCLEIIRNFST